MPFYTVFSKIHTIQANKSDIDFFHTHLFNEKHVEEEKFTQWKQCENGNSSAETLQKLQENIRNIKRLTLTLLQFLCTKNTYNNRSKRCPRKSISESIDDLCFHFLLLTNTRTITAIPTAASIMS